MSKNSQLKDRMTALRLHGRTQERKIQQDVLEQLSQQDCSVIPKLNERGDLVCVYSVGLWLSFKHPEIITVGLPESDSRHLLMDIKTLIRLGHPPMKSRALGRCVEHYPIQLEPIRDRDLIREYLPMGDWFYDGEFFPVVQLFWSDAQGELSWEQNLESLPSDSQTLSVKQ